MWNAPEINTEFPGVKCTDGDTDTFIIYNIPNELNGWYAVCLYQDSDGGMLATEGAELTVSAA